MKTNMILELPALVNPSVGLIFWMTLTFVTVLFLLRKFAWKPIMASLKEREETIENSLQEAANAREEMARLTSQNEALLAQARQEKESILKEAREMKDKIINDAKTVADEEAKRLITRAQDEINKQKAAALDELKKEVAGFSVLIAEKLIGHQLKNDDAQKSLISEQLEKLNKGQRAEA